MSRFFVFISTVLLMLAAGVVVGRLSTRWHGPAAPGAGGPQPPWFDEQLNLSSEQRKQMDAIWGETRQKIEKTFERQRGLSEEREQAIRNLLTDEQKAKYDGVQQAYRSKRSEFEKDFQKLRNDADERSRALLDETQKKRWDELKEMRERRGHRGRGPRGPSTQRSATMPMPPPPGPDAGRH